MRTSAYVFVLLSILAALVLSLAPLPLSMSIARPEWLALMVIFWVLHIPERFGVFSAWCLGLVLDGLEGTLLGMHALAFAIIAYIALKLYQRVRMYALWQQALLVFALVLIKQLLNQWVFSLVGYPIRDLGFLLPALTSALIWPGLVLLLLALARVWGWHKFSHH